LGTFFTLLQTYVLRLIIALIIVYIGFKISIWAKKLVKNLLEKSNVDVTLRPFILSITEYSIKVLVVISAIQQAGVEVTSFVAIIGAASFAVGLAFQGALSNFAGGVLLIVLRIFKVGDFIETVGFSGKVEAINIFHTTLVTPDNKVITIPNGNLSNASVVNFSTKGTRRLDVKFGVGYEQDIDKVKEVLAEIVNSHELVLPDPEPFVRVSEHADSAIIFTVRAWANNSDFWTVHFDLLEEVKRRFDKEGISIPYPQMDVHLPKKD
jgi:small conductance mechanosensitive channel